MNPRDIFQKEKMHSSVFGEYNWIIYFTMFSY